MRQIILLSYMYKLEIWFKLQNNCEWDYNFFFVLSTTPIWKVKKYINKNFWKEPGLSTFIRETLLNMHSKYLLISNNINPDHQSRREQRALHCHPMFIPTPMVRPILHLIIYDHDHRPLVPIKCNIYVYGQTLPWYCVFNEFLSYHNPCFK